MEKLQGFVKVPVKELFELVTQCTKVVAMASNILLKNKSVLPDEEPKKEEIPKAKPLDPHHYEDVIVHKGDKKPFEMIIE
ncbi:MAG: hypothetical protein IKJ50_05215 [Clostridia bacterium]|nr:hypothetical protein [Clostridia bacterium]